MRSKKINLYLLSFFISLNFSTPVFAIFCQAYYGLNSSQITSLLACYSLAVFLFEIPTGIISDKLGEKISLCLGSVLSILSVLCFLSGIRFFLYMGEFIFGVGSTFFSGPFDSILYRYCKGEDKDSSYNTIFSISYAIQWAALCLSFLGCFMITNITSIRFVFFVTLISNIILLLVCICLPKCQMKNTMAENKQILEDLCFDSKTSNNMIFKICFINVFFTVILTSGYQILQTYLLELNIEAKYNGLLYFIAAACASFGAMMYKKYISALKSNKDLISICLILLAISLMTLSQISNVLLVFLLVCIYRFVWGISSPLFSLLVNNSIYIDSYRNTVFSLISLGSNLLSATILFLFSILDLTARMSYKVLSILSIFLVFFILCLLKRKKIS